MHLHCHIVDCVKDFGPAHAFWCYAFERYNGILESVHTNRKSIETQLLKKFCMEQKANNLTLPANKDFLSIVLLTCSERNDIKQSNFSTIINMIYSPAADIQTSLELIDSPFVKLLPPFQQKVLTEEMFQQLKSIYTLMFPHKEIVHMSYFYREYGRIQLASDVIGSNKPGPNSRSSSVVMAYWPSREDLTGGSEQLNVGEVQLYIKHSIKIRQQPSCDPQTECYAFAYVNWRKLHQHCNWFGVSARVCIDSFEQPSAFCFVPVQRIYARCAYAELPISFPLEDGLTQVETVFVACPIPVKYSF